MYCLSVAIIVSAMAMIIIGLMTHGTLNHFVLPECEKVAKTET